MGVRAIVFASFVSMVCTSLALAADPIATAVGVRPAAVGQLGGQQVTIVEGAGLFEGQVLATGPEGEIQVIFADDTHLVIGPRSTLVIERFLMTNAGALSGFAVNALSGTFRFLTGNGPSSAYTIGTPTGTIGIRGTEFDFSYGADQVMSVLLYDGAVQLCATSGACVGLDEPCAIGVIVGGRPALVTEASDRSAVVAAFPYVRGQDALQRPFRVQNPSSCAAGPSGPVPNPGPGSPPAAPGTPPVGPNAASGGAPPPPPASTPPPPPASAPAEPPPASAPAEGNGNNGIGNGGEGGEGADETGNPGHGGAGHGAG